jgi:ectoine hydroxylase-related dioxygenase (phytanoyl-CoA dioxygenase family)
MALENSRPGPIEDYKRDGFAVFRNVVDPQLIEEGHAHVEWLRQRYPGLRPEHLHHPLMRDDAFWVRLVTDSRLLDIAELFLGPNIVCFTSHYICKPARDGHAVLWHQDGAYWDLRPMRAVTLWLALDRSGPDNGCLRMLPGTQHQPLLPIMPQLESPNMLASSIAFDAFREIKPIDVILNPGDVSVHHPHIIHGSEPNRSPHRRCGLDIGYMPADVSIHNEGLYQTPMLVRGQAAPGHTYQPWPEVSASQTIRFAGDDSWDRRAAEHNSQFDHIAPSNEDPLEMTKHMMQRLKSASVKKSTCSGA